MLNEFKDRKRKFTYRLQWIHWRNIPIRFECFLTTFVRHISPANNNNKRKTLSSQNLTNDKENKLFIEGNKTFRECLAWTSADEWMTAVWRWIKEVVNGVRAALFVCVCVWETLEKRFSRSESVFHHQTVFSSCGRARRRSHSRKKSTVVSLRWSQIRIITNGFITARILGKTSPPRCSLDELLIEICTWEGEKPMTSTCCR